SMNAAKGTGDLQKLGSDSQQLRQLTRGLCDTLDGDACVNVYVGTLFLLMFLMLPLILSSVFAAYSVVGEKTSRTLEPLLATPITTTQLLAGKALGAAIPAIGATWAGVAAFLLVVRLWVSDQGIALLLAPQWLVAVGVDGPLLAMLGVLFAILISSRVNDPRAAQQLSSLVVLPLVLLLVGQSMGLVMVNGWIVYVGGALLLLADLGLLALAVGVFEREAILTRWK
ncbi:MAG: ABC transporter permease subunit, partial [Oligoflexia bacterium]|nr:ABC transporter permease subunit [Oligoflexia bacterium]